MPRYSRQQFARAIVHLLEKHPLKDVARVCAQEIVAQRWTRSIDLIVNDITRELLRTKKHLSITLYSAHELPAKLQKEIASVLEKHSKAETSSVFAITDPSLLGGFRAVTPAGELDTTVATKLNQLKQRY